MNQLEKYVNQHFQESLESIKNSHRANDLPFLTLEEKTLIYEYTNWEYFSVNKLLRKNKSENTPEFAIHLNKTLSKIPNYKGIVYRGVELPDTVFEAYQKAFFNKTTFIEYGFLSTSQSQIVAQENFEGDFLFEIFSKTGKSIENIAKFGSYSYDNEYEVLFRKNTHFRVLGITKMSKYTFITLKEVQNMIITSDNIKQINKFEQEDAQIFSTILLDNLFIATSDNEKSINRKILILNSIRETLLRNTDIDALPSDIQELNFIRLISKINAQIEAFEIITGKKDLESLKRAGKRFGQKTQFPIGIS